jgi:hypothetical protein
MCRLSSSPCQTGLSIFLQFPASTGYLPVSLTRKTGAPALLSLPPRSLWRPCRIVSPPDPRSRSGAKKPGKIIACATSPTRMVTEVENVHPLLSRSSSKRTCVGCDLLCHGVTIGPEVVRTPVKFWRLFPFRTTPHPLSSFISVRLPCVRWKPHKRAVSPQG